MVNKDLGKCRCGKDAITEIPVIDHEEEKDYGTEVLCAEHVRKIPNLYSDMDLKEEPFQQFNKKINHG